ncbi:hypothetical protein X953_17195 [Virgibacillus sp. SK37]|nr:hypothetical protein X953_17195 [Virgibacillus sp. SK37]
MKWTDPLISATGLFDGASNRKWSSMGRGNAVPPPAEDPAGTEKLLSETSHAEKVGFFFKEVVFFQGS